MKFRVYLLLVIFFIILEPCYSQDGKTPKVGLVLSGGGAKGFAHIGVIEALEKEGIPVDIVVGTSIGSIIGGLYSIGYNSSQLKEIALNENWTHLLSDYIPRGYKNIHEKYDQDRYLVSFDLKPDKGISLPAGVIEGHNILNRLCELTAKYHEVYDFDKLPIPFACVAADLETDEEVVIRKGFLPEAMFASMSIPTVFAPSQIDGKMVVDGGIVNNFPADIAKQMGADIIIGIDIQTKPLTRNEIGDIMDVISQMISYMGFEKYIETRGLCDIIVEPDMSGYDIASFSNEAADSLIRRGYAAAQTKLEDIKLLLEKNNVPLEFKERKYEFDEEFDLNNFMVEGMGNLSIDYLLNKSDLNFPNKYTFSSIHEGINRLYGSSNFKKTYFRLMDSNDKTFRLIVNERNSSTMNAGFNFNSTDKAAILLNLTLKNEILKSTRLSLDAKLSTNTMFGASFQFYIKSLPEIDLSSLYKNFNIEIFERNKKLSEADVRYFRNSISLSEIFGSNYLLDFGLRAEYYKFNPFSSEDVDTSFALKENTILSLYGKVRFDNLDDKYYPTSGFDLNAEFSYASNEANNIIENTTTPILYYNLKSAISLTKSIAFLPTFYGRFLLNDNSEIFRNNVMGGNEVTKLLDYHLPFIGVSRVIFIKDKAIITKLELRAKLSPNNYLSLVVNGATHFNKFADWKTRELIGGYGLNYSYNSFIGPIDFLVSTSDYTKKFNVFVNVGRWF